MKHILCITLWAIINFLSSAQENSASHYITPADTTKYFHSMPVRELDTDILSETYPWLDGIITEAITQFENCRKFADPEELSYYVRLSEDTIKVIGGLTELIKLEFESKLPDCCKKFDIRIRSEILDFLQSDTQLGYCPAKDGSIAYFQLYGHPIYIYETPEISKLPMTGNIIDLKLGLFYLDDSPMLGWEVKNGKASQVDLYEIIK